MKFKRKSIETMVFIEKLGCMVSFKDGIAITDDKIGKEMIQLGYVNIEDSQETKTKQEPKVDSPKPVESKPQMRKQAEAKPLKPIKPLTKESDEINSEV